MTEERRTLSQKDLAVELGVHESYVSHLLAGRRTPSVKVLKKLAKTLNCSLDAAVEWLNAAAKAAKGKSNG